MKAVQFGAGNIGRGFVGQLLYESGYETTFIDVDPVILSALQARGSYPLRLAHPDGHLEEIRIERVSAVNGRDTQSVARALADADVAGTSVGWPPCHTSPVRSRRAYDNAAFAEPRPSIFSCARINGMLPTS